MQAQECAVVHICQHVCDVYIHLHVKYYIQHDETVQYTQMPRRNRGIGTHSSRATYISVKALKKLETRYNQLTAQSKDCHINSMQIVIRLPHKNRRMDDICKKTRVRNACSDTWGMTYLFIFVYAYIHAHVKSVMQSSAKL